MCNNIVQCWLTTMNHVGSTTLITTVFNNRERLGAFFAVQVTHRPLKLAKNHKYVVNPCLSGAVGGELRRLMLGSVVANSILVRDGGV